MTKVFNLALALLSLALVNSASANEKTVNCLTSVYAAPFQKFEIVFSGNAVKRIVVTKKPFFTAEVYVKPRVLECDAIVGLSKPRYEVPGSVRSITVDCSEDAGPMMHYFSLDRESEESNSLSGTGFYESYNMKTKQHIEQQLTCNF